jgi:hypothetical protein
MTAFHPVLAIRADKRENKSRPAANDPIADILANPFLSPLCAPAAPEDQDIVANSLDFAIDLAK